MSAFTSQLKHTITIRRYSQAAPSADGEDYGHGTRTVADLATIKALVQFRTGMEESTSHDAGTQVTDHVVFTTMTDVSAADEVYAVAAGGYTGKTFKVEWVKDAGGQSHHLELGCQLVNPSPA